MAELKRLYLDGGVLRLDVEFSVVNSGTLDELNQIAWAFARGHGDPHEDTPEARSALRAIRDSASDLEMALRNDVRQAFHPATEQPAPAPAAIHCLSNAPHAEHDWMPGATAHLHCPGTPLAFPIAPCDFEEMHGPHDWHDPTTNAMYHCYGLGPQPSVNMATGGRITTDRADPRLTRGVDDEPTEQAEAYLVLSAEETAKGYVRPFRKSYVHDTALGGCGTLTTMGDQIAATYARSPRFYGATFCVGCNKHRPVGENGEFIWDDGSGAKVGT